MTVKNVLIVTTSLSTIDRIERHFEDGLLSRKNTFFLVEFLGKQVPANLPANCIGTSDLLDQRELDRVCTLVHELGKFEAVISLDEITLYAAADVRVRLGVSGSNKKNLQRFRDKVVMKEALAGSGVRTPKVYKVDELVPGFSQFPIIAKPRAYCGSIGVSLIASIEDLESILKRDIEPIHERYDSQFVEFQKDDLEFEEYISGDVYHIDGVAWGGVVLFCRTSKYINTCLEYINGKPRGNLSVSTVSESDDWKAFATQIVETMKVPNGAFHLEAFFTEQGERVFLEIAARPPGTILTTTLRTVHSIDLEKSHIQCELGIQPEIPLDDTTCSGDLIFPMRFIEEGLEATRFVESVAGFVASELSTLKWSKCPAPGDPAEADFSYEHNLGHFIFGSSDGRAIARDIQTLLSYYKVVDKGLDTDFTLLHARETGEES